MSSVTEKARRAVSAAVAQVIEDSGETGDELARRSGIAKSSISRYRNGIRVPTEIEIPLIEKACNLPAGTVDAIASEILEADLAIAV